MTCSIAFVYGPLPWRPSWAMSGRRVGPWGSIPRPTTGGSTSWTAWPRDPAAPGTADPSDGQCHQPLGRAAGGRLRPGPSRLRAGPDRRRARQTKMGWDPAVDQWGLAGATPPRPVHQGQALWAGGRLWGPARAAAARAG